MAMTRGHCQRGYGHCHWDSVTGQQIKLSPGHFGKKKLSWGHSTGDYGGRAFVVKGLRLGFGVGWATCIWGGGCGCGVGFSAFAGGTFLFFSPRWHNTSYCFSFVFRNVCV